MSQENAAFSRREGKDIGIIMALHSHIFHESHIPTVLA